MQMMKKMFALLLSILMLVSLTGCGLGEKDPNKVEYIRDKNGNVIREEYYALDYSSEEYYLVAVAEYSYDGNGMMTQAVLTEKDDPENRTQTHKFEYNGNGKPSREEIYSHEQVLVCTNTYTYYDQGTLKTKERRYPGVTADGGDGMVLVDPGMTDGPGMSGYLYATRFGFTNAFYYYGYSAVEYGNSLPEAIQKISSDLNYLFSPQDTLLTYWSKLEDITYTEIEEYRPNGTMKLYKGYIDDVLYKQIEYPEIADLVKKAATEDGVYEDGTPMLSTTEIIIGEDYPYLVSESKSAVYQYEPNLDGTYTCMTKAGIKETYYYPDGNVKSCCVYDDTLRSVIECYYESGMLEWRAVNECEYIDELALHCEVGYSCEIYYESGVKKSMKQWNTEKNSWEETYWDEEGNVIIPEEE